MASHVARSEYVRAFLASGMTQAEFCALHRPRGGPSERTLRSWLAALAKPAGFNAEARAIVERAVADLQHLLHAFDAVERVQGREGEDGAERVDAPPAAARGQAAAPALDVPEVPELAAADRRLEGRPGAAEAPKRTVLDDIAAAVQAAVAVAGADGDVQEDAADEQVAVRPAPFSDPWTRGGGFLGTF